MHSQQPRFSKARSKRNLDTDRYATYATGSGSSTLTFQYTVRTGDNVIDLDQRSDDALILNGAIIADVAGNQAILTLAAPGELGSLGANADLVIDGGSGDVDLVSPTVTSATIDGDTLTINFDEDIDSTIPKANSFKVMNGSKKIKVEDVSVDTDADTVVLSLKDAVAVGDVVTFDYKTKKKDQTQDVVQDLAGNDLQSFKGQAVSNDTFVDPNLDLTSPTVSAASIDGDTLTIAFNEDIDETVPKANNFKVMNGSKKIKVEDVSVDIDTDTVVLSLKDAVEADDVITLDYKTKKKDQTQAVVQDLAGNDLQSFKGQAVINETFVDLTPPEVDDAFIDGDKLTIAFNEDIDSTIPKANNFKVMNGSKRIRVEDVSVDTNADTVVLSLKDAVEADDVITLDYKTKKKDQTQDVVEDLAGNDLQSLKGQAVINKTFVDPNIDLTPPEVDDAFIDRNKLTIAFNEDIDSTIPKANNFKVMNGSKKIKIEGVSVDTAADTVVLSLKDAVEPDDVVTFDYKTKSKDQTQGVVQDLAGNDLQSFKGQAVSNITADVITDTSVNDAFSEITSIHDGNHINSTFKTLDTSSEDSNLIDDIFGTSNPIL